MGSKGGAAEEAAEEGEGEGEGALSFLSATTERWWWSPGEEETSTRRCVAGMKCVPGEKYLELVCPNMEISNQSISHAFASLLLN
jgi:hypothetical protein